jgi:WD40 repeat protein
LWDVASKERRGRLVGHKGPVAALAFHPEDHSVLATAGAEGKVLLWKVGQDAPAP